MTPERPIDIWNEMTTMARETGRCMFCEEALFSYRKRPVICTEDNCRKAYHRLYRHLVRNPRARNEPSEVAEPPALPGWLIAERARKSTRQTDYLRIAIRRNLDKRDQARHGPPSSEPAD